MTVRETRRRRTAFYTIPLLTAISLLFGSTTGASAEEQTTRPSMLQASASNFPPAVAFHDYVQDATGDYVEAGAFPADPASRYEQRVVTRIGTGTDGTVAELSKRLERYVAPGAGTPQLATYVTSSSGAVELSWWDPSAGESLWQITRNGVVVATLKGGGFVDRDADVTVSSTYEITGSAKTTDGKNERYLTRIAVPALDTQIIGTSAENINAPRSLARSTRAGGWAVTFQVNTFIPTPFVQFSELTGYITPCLQQLGPMMEGPQEIYRFAGDNRGFANQESTPSSRTRVNTTFYFNGTAPSGLTTSKATSGTKLVTDSGSVVLETDADLSGIQRIGDWGDAISRGTAWEHAASDPLCFAAPAIDYELSLQVAGDGSFAYWGDHDRAPSTEIRLKKPDGVWWNLYQFSNMGFGELFGVIRQHVDVTGAF